MDNQTESIYKANILRIDWNLKVELNGKARVLQSEHLQNTKKFCFQRVFLKLQQNVGKMRTICRAHQNFHELKRITLWKGKKFSKKIIHMHLMTFSLYSFASNNPFHIFSLHKGCCHVNLSTTSCHNFSAHNRPTVYTSTHSFLAPVAKQWKFSMKIY